MNEQDKDICYRKFYIEVPNPIPVGWISPRIDIDPPLKPNEVVEIEYVQRKES